MAGHEYTFVIHERDHFVARDMGQGLMNASHGCNVFHCPAASPCPVELLTSDDVKVLITGASISEVGDLPVAKPWLESGWPLVLRLGFDTVESIYARGWHVLAAPFNWDDLSGLVDRLKADRRWQLKAQPA